MRFNKQELMTLATQPSHKFEKEGVLYIRERQDGFFRRTAVSPGRWCRLRGNILFYFKTKEQWSEPLGVIILEQFFVRVEQSTNDIPYGFSLVFSDGVYQQLGTNSSEERSSWLQALQLASYDCIRSHLLALRHKMESICGNKTDTNIQMWRLKTGAITDPAEIPLFEISLACDNLLCDGHGRPPNTVLYIDVHSCLAKTWVKYARTEIVDRSSNPGFLTTVSFWASDGLSAKSRLRITAYDVRERVSETVIPIGRAIMAFSAVQDTPRLRIPLKSARLTTVGFLTINGWNLEVEDKGNSAETTPTRNMPRTSNKIYYHRRSQSLPPRLGTKITFLHQEYLKNLFTNPYIQTYRFHSGLGGDICVHETMAESKLCFQFPQQLLGIWIQEEKELLQEVAGVGELKEPWHSKQLELIDRHLHLLYLYSQAKENLAAFEGSNFKQSSRKNDRSLEFAPVNLHLQRMWVYNDTLCKYGLYDIISVGVFTAHSHKSKNGGLLRLVQALQDSSIKGSQLYRETSRISMAEEAIQAIKQLRRDVVEAMCSLMKLAKEKQTSGMLSICENMLSKTRILLSLWDPGLVEEALTFLEEYKISKDQDNIQKDDAHIPEFNISHSVSPFERITQQLKFDLKYPEFDEFFTSDTSDYVQDIWSKETSRSKFFSPYSENFVPKYIPYNLWVEDEFKEIDTAEYTAKNNFKIQSSNNYKTDDERKSDFDRSNDLDLSKRFLDTQKICKSPSANYYKPTDELEPWDLTQLNIEASLMCLVSKVKFLCGRCNSPAVRLRKKNNLERNQALIGCLENITSNYPYIVTIQPKTGIKNEETSILLEKDTQHFIPALDKESCTASKAKGGTVFRHIIIIVYFVNKFTERIMGAQLFEIHWARGSNNFVGLLSRFGRAAFPNFEQAGALLYGTLLP